MYDDDDEVPVGDVDDSVSSSTNNSNVARRRGVSIGALFML